MQVQFLNSISNLNVSNINKKYSTPLKNNSNSIMFNNLSNDTFVKSSDISFKGIDKEQVSKVKQNIVEALPAVAFVGAPVLFSLGMTVALARAQNPEQIFLSDGTYFADASELRGPNDNIIVDVANNGSGKEKEEAISILKSMMESNKEAPKITSPMVKRSDTSEITKSIEADKQLAANMNPINGDLMEKIVKRLILEVYDEKEFEYQKFIDTIYNISAAHKTSPVLIPVLNKALRKS